MRSSQHHSRSAAATGGKPVITYAASQTKNSARTALAELNSVLASRSTTAQGFPLPVTLGCVNMLRNLNSRWKSNEPAVLVEGNILFQLYSNSATFTEHFHGNKA
jgi:hypothetical protein